MKYRITHCFNQLTKELFILGFTILSLMFSYRVIAQDIIYTINGKKYEGQIENIDSSKVHFTTIINKQYRTTFVEKSQVDTLIYQFVKNVKSNVIIKLSNGESLFCYLEAEDQKNYYFCLFNEEKSKGSYFPKESVDSVIYKLSNEPSILLLGIGYGLNYGGIGIKGMTDLTNHLKLFGSCGFSSKFVYNLGVHSNFRKEDTRSRLTPYLELMFGANTVVGKGGSRYIKKVFYGPTFGAGLELYSNSGNNFSVGILLPYRSNNINDYIEKLNRSPEVNISNKFPVVELSIGYSFAIR